MQGRGEGSGQTERRNWQGGYLLSGISAAWNFIWRMRSYNFFSPAATASFSPLSYHLPPAPSHSQAPNWLKTNLDGWDSMGTGMSWCKEGRGGGSPGTRPHSKRQTNSTTPPVVYKDKMLRKKIPQLLKKGTFWSYCKNLNESLECWHCLIYLTLQGLNNCLIHYSRTRQKNAVHVVIIPPKFLPS